MGCTHCGATLTPEQFQAQSCAYCGTLLAHHARAAEKVAVVQQLMADRNGNGIPDALEGLMNPGMLPPGGSPYGMPPGAMPPPYGAPMGGYGAPMGGYGAPMGGFGPPGLPLHDDIGRRIRKMTLWIVFGTFFFVFLTFAGVAAVFWFAR